MDLKSLNVHFECYTQIRFSRLSHNVTQHFIFFFKYCFLLYFAVSGNFQVKNLIVFQIVT